MFEFQLFDAAKLDDATVQTLHDRADNLAELQRGFSDACVRLVPPATSFSEWVRRHIEKRAVDMQSFFDAHFTPVDGKFVKTHTDSALARTVGDFEGKKNAPIPELTSVKGGWRSWLRRAAFCLREFVSCRELEEELHRSKLYEVFYADLTNAQSIDEPLDDIDNEMRDAIVRLVRAHIATCTFGANTSRNRQPR